MVSVEAIAVALAGGSVPWIGAEEAGGRGRARPGSRGEWVALALRGVDGGDLACFAVDCGVASDYWRGRALECLDDFAQQMAAQAARAWPVGIATSLAYLALLELAPRDRPWRDADRLRRLAGLGVEMCPSRWSRLWGDRYARVLAHGQQRAGRVVGVARGG